jgi:hypothetical protein
VNQHSLLRAPVLIYGVGPQLSRVLRSPSAKLRLSVFKAMVLKCVLETERTIMAAVSWTALDVHMDDADTGVRGQASYLLRNFSDCEDDDVRGVRFAGPAGGDVEHARIARCGLLASSGFRDRERVEWLRAASSAHPRAQVAARLPERSARGTLRCADAIIEFAGGAEELHATGFESKLSQIGAAPVAGTWILALMEA